jgi:hypothetical protein
MSQEIAAEKPAAEETRRFAVPSSVTVPLLTAWFKNITAAFAGKLSKHGVGRDDVNKALGEMDDEINKAVQAADLQLQSKVTDYLYRKELEKMRFDYMGRALMRDVEKLFPRDPDVAERILSEPVPGHIPIQAAEGLIFALKGAHGTELVEEYERLCAKKAEQYRSPDDLLIDAEKFLADPDVRRLATDVCTRFRLLMHKKPPKEQVKWLLNQITSSRSFREMKRDLTEEEAGAITRAFLKIG